jgi:hypothetical protein
LLREIEATLIPSGYPITLAEGTDVVITQSLGDTYTVTTDQGVLVRIDGEDADALGKQTTASTSPGSTAEDGAPQSVGEAVWAQLRTRYVEIGQHRQARPGLPRRPASPGRQPGNEVHLTAPAAAGRWLETDLELKIQRLPGITGGDIEMSSSPSGTPA